MTDVPVEYLPTDHPDRAERTAKLTGEAMRLSAQAVVEATAKILMQAKGELEQTLREAEEFAQAVKEGTDKHAAKVEEKLLNLKAVRETIADLRKQFQPFPVGNGKDIPALLTDEMLTPPPAE